MSEKNFEKEKMLSDAEFLDPEADEIEERENLDRRLVVGVTLLAIALIFLFWKNMNRRLNI